MQVWLLDEYSTWTVRLAAKTPLFGGIVHFQRLQFSPLANVTSDRESRGDDAVLFQEDNQQLPKRMVDVEGFKIFLTKVSCNV